VVALLGRPNAGKSTLLNRILGEKLAIVTPKPQTTRSRILGIRTLPAAQLLLLDTPGFHPGGRALNRFLNELVREVAEDCDVALVLVDGDRGWSEEHELLRSRLAGRGAAVLVVETKIDLQRAGQRAVPADLRISARTGEGVEELLRAVVARLPPGPRLYGEEALTDRTLRFLAAEQIREVVFEELAQELPYSTAVEIEQYDESRQDRVHIRATLLVERASQKGMVVGRGGAMIRRIGVRAREALEDLLGVRVRLDLWVKVEPRWSRRPGRLRQLGYR